MIKIGYFVEIPFDLIKFVNDRKWRRQSTLTRLEQDEEGKALRDKGGVERTGLQEVIVDRKSNGFENNTKLEKKKTYS